MFLCKMATNKKLIYIGLRIMFGFPCTMSKSNTNKDVPLKNNKWNGVLKNVLFNSFWI